jgi:hypothetical protein
VEGSIEFLTSANIDLVALITFCVVASGFIWRLISQLNRFDDKLDHIIDEMVTRDECSEHRECMDGNFNHHYHIPDDGVVVIKGEKK